MAKRKAPRRAKSGKPTRKAPVARRSAKRPTAKGAAKRQASARKSPTAKRGAKKAVKRSAKPAKPKAAPRTATAAVAAGKVPRLDRARRTLADPEPHSTPSSLDMERRGTAARTGRSESAQNIREHHGMEDVTGGDPDVDIEDAYFAGEEAPGGDNPTPDQDIVEDIGKALGVTYNDNEELEGADKLEKRDKHRWELDPASSDDYKDRD
jgi:Family of unknown function (DUF6335)